jgi:hypothetical protein
MQWNIMENTLKRVGSLSDALGFDGGIDLAPCWVNNE